MADLSDLEKRVAALEEECRKLKDLEAIKRVRRKYWHCVHKGLWDEIGDCFSRDATVDFGPAAQFQGRQAIAQFFKERMATTFSRVVPFGHNPEIEITGDDVASGEWQFDGFMIEAQTNAAVRIGVSYYEKYAKEDGAWRIKRLKIIPTFRYKVPAEPLDLGPPPDH